MRFLVTIGDRIFACIVVFSCMQIPSFIYQYMDYLQGRVDELGLQIESYRSIAAQGGKTIKEFVSKFLSNTDPEIAAQGRLMEDNLVRFDQMSGALASLKDASVWDRGLLFFQNMDVAHVKSVWKLYQPGLSITAESCTYALVGLVGAVVLSNVFKRLLFGSRRSYHDHDFG